MFRFKDIGMKFKLIALFLMIGIIPIIIVHLWSSRLTTEALMERSFEQLESVRDIKQNQINSFFAERRGDMGVMVNIVESFTQSAFQKLKTVQELKKAQIEDFFEGVHDDILMLSVSDNIITIYDHTKKYHDNISDTDGSLADEHIKNHQQHTQYLKNYIKNYGYYDLFIIELDGDVILTAAKERDLDTNLENGPHKDEGLARLWRSVVKSEKTVFEDFSPYTPSNGKQAAFIGSPVHDHSNRLIGVVALQIPTEPVNKIVQRRQGMGKTGDTYLVGKSGNVTSYRSDRIIKQGKIGEEKSGEIIDNAISGKSGQEIKTGNTGELEIISYDPLEIHGTEWAIISTIKLEEAIVPEKKGEDDFFTEYIQEYGYDDFFLIHHEGMIFYSVANKDDHGKNIRKGEYANSGLDELVRQVSEDRGFGMADFEPYAPMNNEPAAFIAQPVVYDNNVQLIVAVRLSLGSINTIMQEREGMGTSGETYLVGPDKKMRSDSFNDSTFRSVKASFVNPSAGSVDTDAVNKAFSGETLSRIIKNYSGTQVLSSFTELNVGDTSWALIAEISKDEVEEPIRSLTYSIWKASVFIALLIAILAFFISKHISDPLIKCTEFTKSVAAGDFNADIDINQKDEIGILAYSLNEMKTKIAEVLQSLDNQIVAVHEGRLSSRADMEAFSGGWRELIVKTNNLIHTLVEHIDNIPVPSTIIDKEFNIRYISSAGASITDSNPEDIIGLKCYDYFRTSDCQTQNCAVGKTFRSGRYEKSETNAHPGNLDLQISYFVRPIKNQEGEVIAAMEVVVDETAIRKAMDSAGETATVIIESVQSLSSSSHEISSTSNEQAAAVKEIVSTMEDSDQLAKSIASKINEVTEAVNVAKDDVTKGFSIIKSSLEKMNEIKDSNSETITEIRSLGDRVESIWDIVNMINGIADQTKIIAFNAELEASSAGEAGKNFQIVASEIRRLADSTVASTSEIKSKIGEIQNSSDKLIITSEEGTEKIVDGWKLSEKLQEIFEEIHGSSEVSANSASQIAVSINQQVSAFEQILLTLKQISEGIDNFVVSTKSTTEQSEKLREMADKMHAVIEEYGKKEE